MVTVKRRDLAAFLELVTNRRGSLPEGIDFPKAVTTPLITGLLGVPIDKAREAGVLAVVCIFEGVSEVQLKGQVLPFTTPYWGLPAIWVASTLGRNTCATLVSAPYCAWIFSDSAATSSSNMKRQAVRRFSSATTRQLWMETICP
ncbi:UNVERIFIED_ORG: hypothetical protein GGE64_005464 [Rhizobium etli]